MIRENLGKLRSLVRLIAGVLGIFLADGSSHSGLLAQSNTEPPTFASPYFAPVPHPSAVHLDSASLPTTSAITDRQLSLSSDKQMSPSSSSVLPAQLPKSMEPSAPSATLPPPQSIPPSLQLPPGIPVETPRSPTSGIFVNGTPVDWAVIQDVLGIRQTGCSSCGISDCFGCRGSRTCHPGRQNYEKYEPKTRLGRFIAAIYDQTCSTDPCYVPRWNPLGNSAFFVESVRPVTQTRLRWDSGNNLMFPDRAEFFWARSDGAGRGPRPVPPYRSASKVDYDDLVMITEASVGGFSIIVETPYRSTNSVGSASGSGFGDMAVGTKSLLTDSEMFQASMVFKTHIPTGNFLRGVGTGHVSFDISLIAALQLTSDSAWQAQIGQWIPIGGDLGYAGTVTYLNCSYNTRLWQPIQGIQLLGTLELNGWLFGDGAYTDPWAGANQSAKGFFASVGPGFRFMWCDQVDLGVGSAFAITESHFAQSLFRFEFRYRF